MFSVLLFTTLYISQYVHAESNETQGENRLFGPSMEVLSSRKFTKGIVWYKIDDGSYDEIITKRIQAAMELIESSSCVVFSQMKTLSQAEGGSWIHFTNPYEIRECVHIPVLENEGEIVIVIGFECMSFRNVLHAVLHGIGFMDEVSHPHRDQYIRVIWQNLQPRYRELFSIQQLDPQYRLVEYDPMSIMHFHDRAFSMNGGPTIASRVPGLHIKPSAKLSQLDVMKLRMWFGHECNKRRVSAVLETCKSVLHNPMKLSDDVKEASVDADSIEDPYRPEGIPTDVEEYGSMNMNRDYNERNSTEDVSLHGPVSDDSRINADKFATNEEDVKVDEDSNKTESIGRNGTDNKGKAQLKFSQITG